MLFVVIICVSQIYWTSEVHEALAANALARNLKKLTVSIEYDVKITYFFLLGFLLMPCIYFYYLRYLY